jgi:class 3 adenylate cyclase
MAKRDEALAKRFRNTLAAVSELSRLRIRTAALENDYIKKLISPKVFHLLDTDPQQLFPKEQEVAVGFADLRNFTQLMNRLQIRQINEALTIFFDHAAQCVGRHGGYLDKFTGDGVMWFHQMGPINESCSKCIEAAVAIASGMPEINKTLRSRLHLKLEIRAGIGVACGHAAVGIFGAPTYLIQYSVLGPPVNLAARLCAEAPGNSVLIGGEAIDHCRFKANRIGFRAVKGFDHRVELQRILIPKAVSAAP